MKKTLYAILIISLITGISLTMLDALMKNRITFHIPDRFQKTVIDLSDKNRTDELLFSNELAEPSTVEFIIQSDDESEKIVKIISDSIILGQESREVCFRVTKVTGSASTSGTFVMSSGRYSVYLTSKKTDGRIAIGYQHTPKDKSEYERLLKVHNGDLNNPPSGYAEVFSTSLSGLSSKGDVVYTLKLDQMKEIGISIYTSSSNETVSVDIVGESTSYYGLAHPGLNRICDQLEATFPAGEYQFKLNCENADGQLYIFLKQ